MNFYNEVCFCRLDLEIKYAGLVPASINKHRYWELESLIGVLYNYSQPTGKPSTLQ